MFNLKCIQVLKTIYAITLYICLHIRVRWKMEYSKQLQGESATAFPPLQTSLRHQGPSPHTCHKKHVRYRTLDFSYITVLMKQNTSLNVRSKMDECMYSFLLNSKTQIYNIHYNYTMLAVSICRYNCPWGGVHLFQCCARHTRPLFVHLMTLVVVAIMMCRMT